ncbi:polysaccharide pyruvyl transferase family protein [Lacipirellula sp.]|uniref:polysaccharide pyruvyl transferase family protein n=1 Tax=Lacipirellula sp. TaxID=2691419 RepID=UPI003D11226E
MKIRAYWYPEQNFGDRLTEIFLREYGLTPERTEPDTAQIVCVGSVLEMIPEHYSGIIFGAGCMMEGTRKRFSKATISALRGRLTRERVSATNEIPLGDPGLLISRWPIEGRSIHWPLGILPHYVDQSDPRIHAIQARYPRDVRIIDVRLDPLLVVEEISRCECLLSSSLHGLVAADAIGVSNRWVVLSNNVCGEGFKFRDYYSAMDINAIPCAISENDSLSHLTQLCRQPSPRIPSIADSLHVTLQKISTTIE